MNAAILPFKNLRLPLASGAFVLACLAACALPMQAFAGTIEDLTSGLSRSSSTVTALPAPGSSAPDLDALVAGLGLEKRDAPPGSLGVSVAVPDGSTVEEVAAALEASPLVSEAFAPALPDAERAAALYAAAQDDPTAARVVAERVAGEGYVPGELIVGFRDSLGYREMLDVMAAWNLSVAQVNSWSPGDRAVRAHVPDGISLERAVGLLRSHDFVKYAELNVLFPLDDPIPIDDVIVVNDPVAESKDDVKTERSGNTASESQSTANAKTLPNTGDSVAPLFFPLVMMAFTFWAFMRKASE